MQLVSRFVWWHVAVVFGNLFNGEEEIGVGVGRGSFRGQQRRSTSVQFSDLMSKMDGEDSQDPRTISVLGNQ